MTYPQISSGVLAQWPVVKRRRMRGVVEISPGGLREVRLDYGEQRCEWELRYGVVTTAERDVLNAFFEAAEGRLQEFTFLDPLGNLLRWSGDWTQDVWSRNPQLQAVAAEGFTALANTGQAGQSVWQTLAVPAGFQYAFGARVRAASTTEVEVYLTDGAARREVKAMVGAEWQTLRVSGRLAATGNSLQAGLLVGVGADVNVAWGQLAAQPGLGVYRETREQGDVYARTRFADDSIVWTDLGPDWHATSLKLTAWAGL